MSENIVRSEVAGSQLADSPGRRLAATGLVEIALLCLRLAALAALAMPLVLAGAIAWNMVPSTRPMQNTLPPPVLPAAPR